MFFKQGKLNTAPIKKYNIRYNFCNENITKQYDNITKVYQEKNT